MLEVTEEAVDDPYSLEVEGDVIDNRQEEQPQPLDFSKLFCCDCRMVVVQQQERCNKDCGKKSRFENICCFHCDTYFGPDRDKCKKRCSKSCLKTVPCCPKCASLNGFSYLTCTNECRSECN